jgi:ATP sulfurylase
MVVQVVVELKIRYQTMEELLQKLQVDQELVTEILEVAVGLVGLLNQVAVVVAQEVQELMRVLQLVATVVPVPIYFQLG